MPKTKDACALQTIDWFIGTPFDRLFAEDSESNGNLYFDLRLNNTKYFSNDNLAICRTEYQFSISMLRRLNHLIERIQKHILRLEKLLKKCGYDNEEKVIRIRDRQMIYLKKCAELDESVKRYQRTKDTSLFLYRKVFDEEFGKRLQAARKKAGLTQVQISQKLNISQNAYSQYERGLREPPLFLILEFSEMFGVSIEYFFGQSDN